MTATKGTNREERESRFDSRQNPSSQIDKVMLDARLTEDAAAPVTALQDLVQNCKKPLFFVGDGAALCYNTYGQVPGVAACPPALQVLRGAGVALAARALWESGGCVPPAALLPDYHRLSQAERERAEKEKQQGETTNAI